MGAGRKPQQREQMCARNEKWCSWLQGGRGHWAPARTPGQPLSLAGSRAHSGKDRPTTQGGWQACQLSPLCAHTFGLVVTSLLNTHSHYTSISTLPNSPGQWNFITNLPCYFKGLRGPLCDWWGFGPAGKSGALNLPSTSAARVSWQTCFSQKKVILWILERGIQKTSQKRREGFRKLIDFVKPTG